MKRTVPIALILTTLVGSMNACKSPTTDSSSKSAGNSSASARVPSVEQESPALQQFIANFVAMKSADDFANILNTLDEQYSSYPADLQFIAAQLLPLTSLRGIGYLVHKLAMDSKVNDVLLVSTLMATASGIDLFSPPPSNGGSGTEAWQAIFDYLTLPYSGISNQFSKVNEIQGYLFDRLIKNQSLDVAINRLTKLNITVANPIVWDNRLIYGSTSFIDGQDRFVTLTDAEKNVAIAGLHTVYHNTRVFLSYNNDDVIAAIERFGKQFGLNVIIPGEAQGLAAQDRAAIIQKFPALFTALPNAGQYMPQAYVHLKAAVDAVGAAWSSTKAQGTSNNNSFQLLNPARLLPWQRITDASISNIKALVTGNPVRSAVTGETITINIPAFYNNPPQNLKAFLPTAFRSGDRDISVAGFQARNYRYGEASQWNVGAFKSYMPDVNGPTDVARAIRILGQVWGGWFASIPTVTMTMAI